MTREQAKKQIELLQAFLDGKTIQRNDGSGWKDLIEGEEWFVHYEYRVKTEPKYRPYTPDEVLGVLKEKGVIRVVNKKKELNFTIISVGCNRVYFMDDLSISFKSLFEDFTYAGGSPCGIEVTE